MPKDIVGVDIGSSSIRAVEVSDANGARPSVLRYCEVPLPSGAAKSGDVLEVHSVAGALKSLWTAGGFKSKDVVLGMGSQRVLARDLTVPKMSLQQIRESLPFQVQEMLPVPVADAILDFYPVSETVSESGTVVNGLLVAAVTEAVTANVNAVQLAGLNTIEVDLVPFALARVFLREQNAVGTIAIIDFGASTTNVVIATNGVPQFVRIIPSGSDDISKALSARLNITAEVAEQAKHLLGIGTGTVQPEHQEAVQTIIEATGQLLTSIRNTLNYFVNSHQQEPIARIILNGSGARLTGFPDALSELTRTPVTVEHGFENIKFSPSAESASAGDRGSMTVALGLALGSTH